MRVKMSFNSRKGKNERNQKGKGGTARAKQLRKRHKLLVRTLRGQTV